MAVGGEWFTDRTISEIVKLFVALDPRYRGFRAIWMLELAGSIDKTKGEK